MPIRCTLFALCCLCSLTDAAEGNWLSIAYKRNTVGTYQAAWAGGAGAALRFPLNIPVEASRMRVWLRHDRQLDLHLEGCQLIPTDSTGLPITFAGNVTITLGADKRRPTVSSDELAAPLPAGAYWLEQVYSDERYPYTYDVDGCLSLPPASNEPSEAKVITGSRPGACYRVDIWCETPTSSLLCYGDSITQGYGSTPRAQARYPDRLAALLERPTLNLGVNGDVVSQAKHMDRYLRECDGIGPVLLLMGINDIIGGRITEVTQYQEIVAHIVAACTKAGHPIYLGTITPAAGYEQFDADPAKEQLRQAINAWIRSNACAATAIVDFDAALRDPDHPERMRSDLHCGDWLHPGDAGYQLMAECAAAVIQNLH